MECLRLSVEGIEFTRHTMLVREGGANEARTEFGRRNLGDALRAPTNRTWVVREPEKAYRPAAKPRLLDQVRDAIRARHMTNACGCV